MRHFTGNGGKTQPHPVFILLDSANIDFNGKKTELVIPVESGDDQPLLCFPKLHEGTAVPWSPQNPIWLHLAQSVRKVENTEAGFLCFIKN